MKHNRSKKYLFLLIYFFISGFIFAIGRQDSSQNTICVIRGPSSVGMIRLFENPPVINGISVKVEALANQDLMASRFIAGEISAGILPPNLAAKIASSGKDLRAAAVIGNGMLSLLTSDDSIKSIADLKGKTVEVAGQGATPDYVFRKILSANGIAPDSDLRLGYSLAYPEMAQSLIAGRISTALFPEPFATMALLGRPSLRPVFDVQAEWARTGGSENYPMTLLVFDGAFAAANPGAVQVIMSAVKDSIEWVRRNPAEAGTLVEKHELGLRAHIVAASVQKSNYVFIPAAEARPSIEALLKVFYEYAPVSIGGALPSDGFYLK